MTTSDLSPCRWRTLVDDGRATCSSGKIVGGSRHFDPCRICTRCPFVDHPPFVSPAVTPIQPARGPGTELSTLLSWWGFDSDASCACKRHAAQMDSMGVAWCADNIETIVSWLREEAERRGLPFVAWLARAVVRKAIKRARLNQRFVNP